MMLLPVCDKGMSTLYPKIVDKDINFFGNVKSHEWRMLQKWRIIIIAACEWKMCEIGAIVGGMSVKMSNFVV
mgnify:FL=1